MTFVWTFDGVMHAIGVVVFLLICLVIFVETIRSKKRKP